MVNSTFGSVLHRLKRYVPLTGEHNMNRGRRALAARFIRGVGVEVGAGNRPFPLPKGARCRYGDIRDRSDLSKYFGDANVSMDGEIDAQTMACIAPESLDFVISAHVIEHLYDPIGAITATLHCLKPGGVFLLVVPELTKTFDRARPATTIEHLVADAQDGGRGTRRDAYVEHARYVHSVLTGESLSEEEVQSRADLMLAENMDLHVHAWREKDFFDLLQHVATQTSFSIEARQSISIENLYALRKPLVR